MSKSFYGPLLRSSALIGGAQAVFIVAGLFKMKVAAVLIGPAGVGLVGLFTNLVLVVSTLASVGMGHAGTRQLAAAHAAGDPPTTDQKRKALYAITGLLAMLGAAALWLGRHTVASAVLGDAAFAAEVAWLSVGVALTVATAGQTAWLTGLRRVGDLARVSVGTALISTVFTVWGLWVWGEGAVLLMVLSTPAVAFVLGHVYAARVKHHKCVAPVPWAMLAQEWRALWPLGLSFMAATVLALLGQLVVRALVQRELGLEAAGQFQAAWSIGMTYMGLVLGVMTSDFHPRLAGMIDNKPMAVQLVNQQTEIAVLLCAPMVLLLLGLAPRVVHLLYTPEFAPAVDILRWQLLGDVLKVASLPLGFVLLAAGAKKTYLLAEALGMLVFVCVVWLGLPVWGLQATGLGFMVMYGVYLPYVLFVANRLIGLTWSPTLKKQLFALAFGALSVVVVASQSENWAAGWSLLLSVVAVSWALKRLKEQKVFDLFLKRN